MYKRHDIAPLGPKNRKAQYKEGQKSGEDGKDKKGRENERVERGERDHYGNKINLVVEKSSNSETSVYHHLIYRCY